MYVFYVGSVEL